LALADEYFNLRQLFDIRHHSDDWKMFPNIKVLPIEKDLAESDEKDRS
jgi:hypothetical protein